MRVRVVFPFVLFFREPAGRVLRFRGALDGGVADSTLFSVSAIQILLARERNPVL
jgi:hypothetical protein